MNFKIGPEEFLKRTLSKFKVSPEEFLKKAGPAKVDLSKYSPIRKKAKKIIATPKIPQSPSV